MIDLSGFCRELTKKHSKVLKAAHSIVADIFQLLHHPSAETEALFQEYQASTLSLSAASRIAFSGNQAGKLNRLWSAYGLENAAHERNALPRLLFSLQTFYTILIKLLIREQITAFSHDATDSSLLTGEFFLTGGVRNLNCHKAYSWLLYEKDGSEILGKIKSLLLPFYCESVTVAPDREPPADLLKLLYETIIPSVLRHALGEYYTPDYLASAALQRALALSQIEATALRIIDPCCGSGTFLVHAIHQKRQKGASLSAILQTVHGIDLHPLAVFTAKANYLLAMHDLWDKKTPITLPVYEGDLLSPLLSDEETGEEDTIRQLSCFDLVIGNPPWINWEYLQNSYRRKVESLWLRYGFFQTKGTARSFVKEDLSQLLTYAALDIYLAKGGILAFLLPQSIFKSQQNGAAFRRFFLPDHTPVKVEQVEDLSTIRIFPHAMTAAALLLARKGERTSYPVPYLVWEKKRKPHSFPKTASLTDVMQQITIHHRIAFPSQAGDPASPWITGEPEKVTSLRQYLGTNSYSAKTGIFTGGANSVYWLTIQSANSDFVTVTNVISGAKRKAPSVTCELEPTFLYPMVKGKNINTWKVSYDSYLLCPHTAESRLYPVSEEILSAIAPKTLQYLKAFEPLLRERRGFSGWEREIQQQSFHAILRVGSYSFSPYKVVWRYIAKRFICAVIGTADDPYLGEKLLLPNDKVMYLSTNSSEEAYYLCGILSSSPISACIESFMTPTCISAHVLKKLRLPPFQPDNPIHRQISMLCKEGHGAEDITPFLQQIDSLISALYQ